MQAWIKHTPNTLNTMIAVVQNIMDTVKNMAIRMMSMAIMHMTTLS